MIWESKRFELLDIKTFYEIVALRVHVFIIEQTCFYEELDYKDQSAYHVYVKDENGQILAYLRVLDPGISYEEVSIGRVVVAPASRGTGLGRALMLKGFECVKSNYGDVPIRISAQAYLQNFYESLGFVADSEVYEEDGIPHLEMVKGFAAH